MGAMSEKTFLKPAKALKPGVKKTIMSADVAAVIAKFDRPKLNAMAEELLEFYSELDPIWKIRIGIVRADNNFDALQTLGSLTGKVLDAAEHTVVPGHPFFEAGFVPMGSNVNCPECNEPYTPEYPGQPLCGKFECAKKHYAAK